MIGNLTSRGWSFGQRGYQYVMADADEDLVDRAIRGDRDGLVALLELHGPDVRSGLAGAIDARWRSLLSIDDVMQQTYLDAFLGIHRFVPRGANAFSAWLETLAKRNLLDAVRMLQAEKRGGRRIRVEPQATDESLLALYDLVSVGSSTPSRYAARGEARLAMERAIEGLSPAYRQVVKMCDLDGQSVAEVAPVLERSVGAVCMLRARAHDQLRELMGPASKYLSDSE